MKKAEETMPGIDRITVLPIEEEDNSIIKDPKPGKEKPQWGLVVAVGPIRRGIEYAQNGDHVAYGKYAGIEMQFEDGLHVTIFQSEIINKY